MKRALLLLATALTTSAALAADHVPLPLVVGHLATRDGKVYEGATIIGEDEVGVKVQHDGGTARVLYSKLPDDLAKKFAVSAAEGKTQQEENEKKQKEAAEAQREREKEVKPQGGYIPNPPAPPAAAPVLDAETQAKIAALQAYLAKLKKGVQESTAASQKATKRAQELRARAEINVVDATGHTVASGTNGSVLAKAEFQENQAAKEQAKIAEAQGLIAQTEAKIVQLKNTPPAPPALKPKAN
ncbi:MAG: hypothetical protein JWO82_3207 [Akkermansiaceae bacterium]|nr:hypothetical protein [Akkermansiaceae bacterium]